MFDLIIRPKTIIKHKEACGDRLSLATLGGEERLSFSVRQNSRSDLTAPRAEELRGLRRPREEWRCVPTEGNLRMALFIWLLIHRDGGKRGGRRCFGHVDLSV